MRVGQITTLPSDYSRFAQIRDASGSIYSVEMSELPEKSTVGDDVAYKLEIWGNDSGLAYDLEKA